MWKSKKVESFLNECLMEIGKIWHPKMNILEQRQGVFSVTLSNRDPNKVFPRAELDRRCRSKLIENRYPASTAPQRIKLPSNLFANSTSLSGYIGLALFQRAIAHPRSEMIGQSDSPAAALVLLTPLSPGNCPTPPHPPWLDQTGKSPGNLRIKK